MKVGQIESILEKMAAINFFFNYSPKCEKLLKDVVNEMSLKAKIRKFSQGFAKRDGLNETKHSGTFVMLSCTS